MADSPTLFALKQYFKQRSAWRVRQYAVKLRCVIPPAQTISTRYTIIPIPRATTYQRLINDVIISPISLQSTVHEIKTNRFLVIANDMHLSANREVTVHCDIEVEPRQYQASKSWRIADYSNDVIVTKSSNLAIVDIAKTIVAQSGGDIIQTAQLAYEYVIDHLQYGNPIRGLYSAQQALQDKRVDCGGFSSLLVAIYQACGIPARLVTGYWAGYSTNEMHAWMEWMLPDGTWVANDASTDYLRRQQRTYKTGGFMNVGSDRIVVSQGAHLAIPLPTTTITLDVLQTPVQVTDSNELVYLDNYTWQTS